MRRGDDDQPGTAGGDGIAVQTGTPRPVAPVDPARGRVQPHHFGVGADLIDVDDQSASDQPLPVHVRAEPAAPLDVPCAGVDGGDGPAQVGVHGPSATTAGVVPKSSGSGKEARQATRPAGVSPVSEARRAGPHGDDARPALDPGAAGTAATGSRVTSKRPRSRRHMGLILAAASWYGPT